MKCMINYILYLILRGVHIFLNFFFFFKILSCNLFQSQEYADKVIF